MGAGSDAPLQNLPHANQADAVRNYAERYYYDAVSNILELDHRTPGSPGTIWSRGYTYTSGTNRLASHSAPGGPVSFSHDAHGNMVAMPHLSSVAYTPFDQMRHADLGGGGDGYYTYDASGRRVRKVVVEVGEVIVKERIYLGSCELFRRRVSGDVEVERSTLHIHDGARRVAMVETLTIDDGDPVGSPVDRVRYQLDNHLGSACLELDGAALVISYEEYHPYGTTSYRASPSGTEVSAKRYRYNGKERDEETGLYDYGARYYAAWLGRWTTADPLGVQAGLNVYLFCRAGPVNYVDPDGKQETSPGVLARAGSLIKETFIGSRDRDAAAEARANAAEYASYPAEVFEPGQMGNPTGVSYEADVQNELARATFLERRADRSFTEAASRVGVDISGRETLTPTEVTKVLREEWAFPRFGPSAVGDQAVKWSPEFGEDPRGNADLEQALALITLPGPGAGASTGAWSAVTMAELKEAALAPMWAMLGVGVGGSKPRAARSAASSTTIASGSQVTEQVIRDAMKGAPLRSQQLGGVSLPQVQQYVDRLLAGEAAPAIKVDGDMLVDGNHRYIAGRILGKEPPIQQWTGGRPGKAVPWETIPIDPRAW